MIPATSPSIVNGSVSAIVPETSPPRAVPMVNVPVNDMPSACVMNSAAYSPLRLNAYPSSPGAGFPAQAVRTAIASKRPIQFRRMASTPSAESRVIVYGFGFSYSALRSGVSPREPGE